MALSTVCAFSPVPPSSLSSIRQLSSISRQTCAVAASRMQSPSAGNGDVLDRRAMLRNGVSTVFAAGFASDAFAAGKGDWAKHSGPFSDSEFEGFSQTPSGLKYKDIEVGQGPQPNAGQKIKAHYSGYLLSNGNKFDSSYDRGQPLPFNVGVGQVIKGWDEGLLSMKVGGKRILLIPSELAYGKRNVANGLIPPNSVLVFYVELVSLAA
ncbi:FKBP-type peptidyl-prolyl cis-trans isomerase [Guillardia theta CCMP2712]|uniref:peptidylprolyl isomerase n=2 Tax=Guillardia theta TaxID=55529 RepID=L1JA07_GUITC|nr:FKBP-type peptidyl-prolyl cis-trans isomerase [Guillardia theta CCMP2712]EKX45162.1 FKBP-type peptidyl-prolyl cis-trans isomerase [Guillardia theta CCMP2712]|eukprot:XP_005832142.1 FKBP-type peptidyl-prolyl cis-trans isomerase [Guillardia theta CCMP2712]